MIFSCTYQPEITFLFPACVSMNSTRDSSVVKIGGWAYTTPTLLPMEELSAEEWGGLIIRRISHFIFGGCGPTSTCKGTLITIAVSVFVTGFFAYRILLPMSSCRSRTKIGGYTEKLFVPITCQHKWG